MGCFPIGHAEKDAAPVREFANGLESDGLILSLRCPTNEEIAERIDIYLAGKRQHIEVIINL